MRYKPCFFLFVLSFSLLALSAAPSGNLDYEKRENLISQKTLVMTTSNNQLDFNPLQSYTAVEAQIFSGIYEGLVAYHPFTLEPLPGAAKYWDVSQDGKTYRFFLRDNNRYWNGDTLTSGDFRDTWMLLLNPAEEAPYSFLFDVIKGAKDYRTGKNTDPESVAIRAVDAFTLEIELEDPADHFLKLLCHHSFSPLHPLIRNSYSKEKPVPGLGNGPFYLYSQDEGQLVFLKNELYWDAANVRLREFRILLEDDREKTTEMFNNGEIHWSMGNIDIEKVENTQTLILNPMFATSYYFFAAKTEPFNDSRITRALALLLPWEEIRSEEKYHIPTDRIVPELSDYPQPETLSRQDKVQAMALLEEAGYPGGKGLPPIVIRLPQGAETYHEVALIKETWESDLETSVNLELVPWREYYTSLKGRSYALGQISWIGDFADPLTFLQMWESGSNLNDGGYSNPDYDALLEAAAKQSGDERMAVLSQAESLLLSGGAVMPVNHQPALNIIDLSLIEGWFPNPMDIHPFKYMGFSLPQLPPNVAERNFKNISF